MSQQLPISQRIRGSLFLRLLFIFGMTVLLLFVIAGVTSQSIWENNSSADFGEKYFNKHLVSMIDELIVDIGTPPDPEKAAAVVATIPMSMVITGPQFLWQSEQQIIDLSRLKVIQQVSSDISIIRVKWLRGVKVSKNGYDYHLFWNGHLLSDADFSVVYLGIALMLGVLLLNYLLVRRLFSPIGLLKEGAERISNGELDYRVTSARNDELGELTNSINSMADSLQQMLEAKQQLLLAISHEIRSPITRAKVQLEFVENEVIKSSLLEDINEVDALVSELLEAERLNSQHAAINTEPTAFNDYVQHTVATNWPNSDQLQLQLLAQDQTVAVDHLRMSLLLRNIINNAMRYSENQAITISLAVENQQLQLSVQDNGIGISAEHLPHLTEPFYRADSARQRQTGGFGLGLYLCQLIAEAHGGSLHIESELGRGTRVSVILPMLG